MSDDLDDILASALDEVELDDNEEEDDKDLSSAVKKAAEESAVGQKNAEQEASNSSNNAPGLGGMENLFGNGGEDLLKELNDPEFAKTLEETLKMFEKAGDGAGENSSGFGDDAQIQETLQALASAQKGVEGADAGQAEQMGEEIMQQMMKQFESMGDKEDFQQVIDGMMQQLLGKDVMFEPMKKIVERFPAWLAENEPQLEKSEYERYGKQYQYFQKLVACYETEPDNFARISELMQEMQECGQPPVEIIKELAPGLSIGEDGVPVLPGMGAGGGLPPGMANPENCAQQ